MASNTPTPTTPIDLVRELREALGMFAGAMPITPQQAWEEALDEVRMLRQGWCANCMDRERWRTRQPRSREAG